MRILAGVLLFLGFFATPVFGGSPLCEDCDVYHNGVSRKVVPTDEFVCFYFVQAEQDTVVLRLDLQDGTERRYSRKAGTDGHICVGRQWVRNAERIVMCNAVAHAVYEAQDVRHISEKEKYSREGTACLSGREKCRAMGYRVSGEER